MRTINLIVIHCTASQNGEFVSVDTIRGWHIARGFRDIGYHYVIDVDGSVGVGRPEDQVGAHVEGHNATSIGIALVGGVGGEDRINPGVYSQAQWDSLRSLVCDLQGRYAGAAVKGHREFSPDADGDGIIEPREFIKLCPSFDVPTWLAGGMTALDGQVA
jgi:N-acetylmuramoyl-L-alanine amidase